MGIVLRQAASGEILRGENDGDALIWDETAGEWVPGVAGTVLPDGTYDEQPLAWLTDHWGPAEGVTLVSISQKPGSQGVNIQGGGSILDLKDDGSQFATLGASLVGTIRLSINDVPNVQVDVTGIGFYGAAPVARPAITGATTQLQVDSLVSALVALGLVTDAR